MTKKIYIYDNPEIEISYIDENTPNKDIIPLGTDALAHILGSNFPSGAINALVLDIAEKILENFPLEERELKKAIWNGIDKFVDRRSIE